jgi:hypothetical protein
MAGDPPKEFASGLLVLCCRHVAHFARPVLAVGRDDEGDWQFLCGYLDHDYDDSDELYQIHVAHLVALDPTVAGVADLSADCHAERESVGARWIRNPN